MKWQTKLSAMLAHSAFIPRPWKSRLEVIEDEKRAQDQSRQQLRVAVVAAIVSGLVAVASILISYARG